jgi:tRNA A-37 threonylcarbamoyl transferase component Bud32
MNVLTEQEYLTLIDGAKLLEKDTCGPKVFLTVDRKVCKLFRCKRTFSSTRLYPYVKRFANNANTLRKKGIPSVSVCEVYRVPHIDRDLVHYEFLEGKTLRDTLQEGYSDQLIEGTARFIAQLHNLGIYFRSLHFGNIIILPNGDFGLIDISDMKIKRKSLSLRKRVRNFKALMRYEVDLNSINNLGFKPFVEAYLQASNLTMKSFLRTLRLQTKHPATEYLLKK